MGGTAGHRRVGVASRARGYGSPALPAVVTAPSPRRAGFPALVGTTAGQPPQTSRPHGDPSPAPAPAACPSRLFGFLPGHLQP